MKVDIAKQVASVRGVSKWKLGNANRENFYHHLRVPSGNGNIWLTKDSGDY